MSTDNIGFSEEIRKISAAVYESCTLLSYVYEPAHDKTYYEACETSKDLDQPAHVPSSASEWAI